MKINLFLIGTVSLLNVKSKSNLTKTWCYECPPISMEYCQVNAHDPRSRPLKLFLFYNFEPVKNGSVQSHHKNKNVIHR